MKNTKPLGGKSYGSIPHLLGSKLGPADKHIHQGQHDILTRKKRDKHDTIIVTEKYDGSNVSIAKKDGKIFALTRSGYEASTSPYKQHHAFAYWVKKNYSVLNLIIPEGFRLCCEWLWKRHSLEYVYVQNTMENSIVAFDLIDIDNKRISYLDFINYDIWAIPKARILHIGDSVLSNEAIARVNTGHEHTVFCTERPEGVVYRCERKGVFDFCAKFVRHDFEAGKYLDK